MKKAVMALSLLVLPLSLYAHISGTYRVEGHDPFAGSDYTGTIVIHKNGQVYDAAWEFNDGTHETGTGLKVGEELSFVFQGVEDNTDIGVQVYKIKHDKLKGPWTLLGENLVGEEKITKISD